MTDSLRDQLLGLGFKAAAPEGRPEPKRDDRKRAGRPQAPRRPPEKPGRAQERPRQPQQQQRPQPGPRAGREDIDLAKAYAIRAQREKDERIEVERQKQEQARQRREAKARLAELLQDKALNDPAADIARHFDYGGKIKRIYVNAEQLKALNSGLLGVVQLDGRYLLVDVAVLETVAD